MLPWDLLREQFPGFQRPHNPMFWYNQRPVLVGERLFVVPVDSAYIFFVDRRTGKPIRWQPAPMVHPVSARMTSALDNETYTRRVEELKNRFDFEIVN